MAKWQENAKIKAKQFRVLGLVILAVMVVFSLITALLSDGQSKAPRKEETIPNLTGIVDESFVEQAGDTALVSQQIEVEELKNQVKELVRSVQDLRKDNEEKLQNQKNAMNASFAEMLAQSEAMKKEEVNQESLPWESNADRPKNPMVSSLRRASVPKLKMVSFRKKVLREPKRIHEENYLNPAHYVPSNTSVRAVVLGGADADASVEGQSKNNGVMLFKFLENGTLPNGKKSQLSGCRVSANSYGDISSERAFATLYKLSCAKEGQPIIDKEVTGWVFFNGKVGIKGKPLMRDNKVMAWAGFSGALSGVAQAAQYAQSVQAIGPYGATSVVPSSQIGPFAAYGGASKAADTLSQYYVKRAEQYHPVVQVGSGNIVTVVFKDGFYLEPEEAMSEHAKARIQESSSLLSANETDEDVDFAVPPEVLAKIDGANNQGRGRNS